MAPTSSVQADGRTTGEQVNLFVCDDIDADTAFHVRHGFRVNPREAGPLAQWTFDLEVDGALLPSSQTRIVSIIDSPDPEFLSTTYVYNFPDGLEPGEHVLRGIWTEPDGTTTDLSCTIDF